MIHLSAKQAGSEVSCDIDGCYRYCNLTSYDRAITDAYQMELTEGSAGLDLGFMQRALGLARQGAELGEVPVGAVLVRDGEVLGEACNQVISAADPTAHAECVALRAAAKRVGNYRLPGSTLYVTLEPCTMCAGALVHARVERLVFATREPRAGVICSQCSTLGAAYFNHRVRWEEGLLAEESAALLQGFFRERR